MLLQILVVMGIADIVGTFMIYNGNYCNAIIMFLAITTIMFLGVVFSGTAED